jgi:hypothetical protein
VARQLRSPLRSASLEPFQVEDGAVHFAIKLLAASFPHKPNKLVGEPAEVIGTLAAEGTLCWGSASSRSGARHRGLLGIDTNTRGNDTDREQDCGERLQLRNEHGANNSFRESGSGGRDQPGPDCMMDFEPHGGLNHLIGER